MLQELNNMTKNQFKEAYLKFPKNFMTPEIIKWEIVGINENMKLVELSRGLGIGEEDIYGVSILQECKENKYRLETLSDGKMFTDKKLAEKYYSKLISII